MSNVLAVAGAELRLFLRDRANIFFVLIFPLMLVTLIGLQFGEGATTGRVAVSGPESRLEQGLVRELESEEVSVSRSGWDDALQLLARGRLDVAVRVDDAAAAAHESGDSVRLEVVRGSAATAQVVEQQVRTAVDVLRSERARLAALEQYGVPAGDAEAELARAQRDVSTPALEVTSVDELSRQFEGLGQYDFGASGQLLLFVFLTSLAGSATLIRARRLGVVARVLAAPVTAGELVAGQIAGRWAIALFQGGYIMLASTLLFGVSWGTLWLALLVVVIFSLVAAGAAILLGTLVHNEGAASGAGIGLGLVLAALGGSMMPLEFFPDTMRTIANLTPHAWGYEAFAEIQRRDGTFTDVLPQLGVLTAMAMLVAAFGAWALRRSLTRAM